MLSDLFFRPALSKEAAGPELKKPKISFKKFNKFNRPDIRKTLLEKILKKGGGKNTVEESSAEKVIYLAIAPGSFGLPAKRKSYFGIQQMALFQLVALYCR